MVIRSIGLATELALATTRGRVVDRGDCLVVRTPSDPDWVDGNLLVMPAAPPAGELAAWLARFVAELPDVPYRSLRWDGPPGDTAELVAAGFTVDILQVMVADAVVIAAPPALPVRELTADEVAASHVFAAELGEHHHDGYRQFLRRRAAWHAALVARGEARFWGAHDGGELVASLGLVELGERARFQDVRAAEPYRRRGFARALIAAAATATRALQLVIVAAPDSAAARLYERLGFRPVERTATASRLP